MSVDLNNVRFSYPGGPDKAVLDIRHWSVNSGECVFVHGSSGSGKSTLLNVLSGMLAVQKGEVSILGRRLDLMNGHQRDRFRADHIGYVFQQFNLIPYLDAIDNIRLSVHFSSRSSKPLTVHSEAKELLSTLNVAPSDWHKPASHLSIGQQQRVAIARALIKRPELLIADEPTSSLDQGNRDTFMSVLLSLVNQHDTTLIFVSHDKTLSSYFNRIDLFSDTNDIRDTQ